MQKGMFNSLKLEAESDLATGDFWNNSREALDKVADARDRLETLEWIKRTLAEAD